MSGVFGNIGAIVESGNRIVELFGVVMLGGGVVAQHVHAAVIIVSFILLQGLALRQGRWSIALMAPSILKRLYILLGQRHGEVYALPFKKHFLIVIEGHVKGVHFGGFSG